MKVTREQSKYPYYGKAKNGNVVYFTAPSTGIVVTRRYYEVGHQADCWTEKDFTPIPNPFDEKKFEPITITLETEEEAIAMWMRLNTPEKHIEDTYTHSRLKLPTGQTHPMWESFNDVFDPRK